MYDSFNVVRGGESLGAGVCSHFYIIESLFIDVYVADSLYAERGEWPHSRGHSPRSGFKRLLSIIMIISLF